MNPGFRFAPSGLRLLCVGKCARSYALRARPDTIQEAENRTVLFVAN